MDYTQGLVKEFHEVFGHPTADAPTPMSADRATSRMTWTAEECVEFIAASVSSKEEFHKYFTEFSKGVVKAYEKSLEGEFPQTDEEKIVAQADALADQNYFVNGSAVETGINLEGVTAIVHESNMSKLFIDENGNRYPKYDPNNGNKIMKSEHFFKPEGRIRAFLLEVE